MKEGRRRRRKRTTTTTKEEGRTTCWCNIFEPKRASRSSVFRETTAKPGPSFRDSVAESKLENAHHSHRRWRYLRRRRQRRRKNFVFFLFPFKILLRRSVQPPPAHPRPARPRRQQIHRRRRLLETVRENRTRRYTRNHHTRVGQIIVKARRDAIRLPDRPLDKGREILTRPDSVMSWREVN